jgi:soluble lytic murein transglycosylase-like protein
MPRTADLLGVENPYDAEENILGGTRYLRELINLYEGNLNRALAAYNAGPERAKGGIPDIKETKNFIDSVLRNYNRFSQYREERFE